MGPLTMAALLAMYLSCLPAIAQEAGGQIEPPMPALEAQPGAQPTGLTDQVIRKAVRETVAESPQPTSVGANRDANAGDAFSAARSSRIMAAAFDEAKVPDCLHGDALKNQPARIGFIAVVGPYAIPWVIAAALRGKCL